MNGLNADWRMLRTTSALLLVCSFCLFLPSLYHELFADDEIYLAFSNRMVRQLPWTDLHLFLQKPANRWEFLPLRDFTYWLDFRLFGDEPMGFHFSNLAWYALSAIAFFWLVRELVLLFRPAWANQAGVLALCGTVLFVVHPAHVEAAAWVASRKDLMAGTFGFLAAATLARGLRAGWPVGNSVLAALLLLCACFSKAAGMTQVLFLTLLLAACWRQATAVPVGRKVASLLLPWAVVVVAAVVHMQMGESTGIRIENHPGTLIVLDRASRIFSTLGSLLLVPYPLGLYHDVYRLGEWHWLSSGLGLLLVLLALRTLCVRRALWPLGVVMAVAPWLVYLQFLPFTTWSMASERFLFVSVGGLVLVLVDILGRVGLPRRIIPLLLLLTVPMGVITWMRMADWELGGTLRTREYERQPHFHNAIRDQVIYTLLANRQYAEAESLAGTISRDYAAAALTAAVNAERAFREREEGRVSEATDPHADRAYCQDVASLRNALTSGYTHIVRERDLSYNNLLRSIERQAEFRYADYPRICDDSTATAAH